MIVRAYYNEIEPAAAHVLRALIADNVIAPGDVDDRSIKDINPNDLKGYTQCHFFAGGGLWSVAARLAGWPDDQPLWTGSCPCQPFSVAGKGAGEDDPRHLWPDFFRLIRSCRPAIVVGEQVAGAAGYRWFDGVAADLEGEGYAGRAVDIPACSIDAPHIRQRLYWVAQNMGVADRARRNAGQQSPAPLGYGHSVVAGSCGCGDVADSNSGGRRGRQEASQRGEERGTAAQRSSGAGVALGDACRARLEGHTGHGDDGDQPGRVNTHAIGSTPASSGRNGSFWSDSEWLTGADGKARRAKPGVRLLAHGVPGRVGLLRIGGNAIVPQVAAEVLAALMETATL